MLLNVERPNDFMAREQLDAVVAASPENVTYLSGYWALSQWIRRGPQTYVIWPAPGRGEPTIVASSGLLDLLADQDVWVKRVRRFGSFFVETDTNQKLTDMARHQAALFDLPDDGGPIQALTAVLRECGLENPRIGLDEGGILPNLEAKLRDDLPHAQFSPAFELFRKVRAVQEGALPVLGCIGFGERSAMGNVQPSDRELQAGDVIRFDVGGRFEHYRADIARIASFGEPSKKVATYHRALHAGVLRAYEIMRPGASIAAVFDDDVETVRREGLPRYRRSHVGHGIGLDGYDGPNLTPGNADLVEEGMVLSVETPYYELGFAGLQFEDMVVVRSHGLESLMETDGKPVTV